MVSFQINIESLSPSETFLYLGRKISYNNINWIAVYQNLNKACRWWGVILRVFAKIGAMLRSHVVMYKTVDQLVLLYGSESWVVTGVMLKFLEGFYHQVSKRITG